MRSTTSLIKQLKNTYPQFAFVDADQFWWSADHNTVYIDPDAEHSEEYTLHELSHALLDHKGYRADIELIKLERDAWEHARTNLAATFGLEISEDIIQDNLDTYREWLHARSKCPDCSAIGLQATSSQYRCLACGHTWRVNEARLCALRRYSLTTK